jgi:ribonuclease G
MSEYIEQKNSKLTPKLKFYEDKGYSLNKLYSIETKLELLLGKRVWLKSGAYLVIEKTEAMYVIDVNSGKNISKKANADYIYSINLEAAEEIMYQIRLRNLTGMILVDFINMDSDNDKEQLLEELSFLAGQDRIRTDIIDMTALDLVEITRLKNRKSLSETYRSMDE